MKKVMQLALALGCCWALLGCGDNDASGDDAGGCPAALDIVMGSTEMSCEKAVGYLEEGDGLVQVEIECETKDGYVEIELYENEHEDPGETKIAAVYWENGGREYMEAFASFTSEYDVSADKLSGSLAGTLDDGTKITACWDNDAIMKG